MTEQPTCLCCGVPLDALRAPTKLCGKLACAWKHQITPPSQRCKICQRILTIGQFAQRLCASESCRRAWAQVQHGEEVRLQQEQRERLEAQVARWRDCLATEVPESSSYPVALVPYNPAAPTALPASRREALRAHLIDIATKATAAKASRSEIAEPETSAYAMPSDELLIHACGACRGSCCRNGGERAYLTSETIERYLNQFPGSSVG